MKKIFIYSMLSLALAFTACHKEKEQAMYEGKDMSQQAQILRDKETRAARLELKDMKGPWKIYAGRTVESIDFSKPLLEGNGSGTFPLAVSDSARSYFELVTEEGKAILAERQLPMQGGYNFRDLGGMRTTDGKYVKWGKLFRSDELAYLTDSDLVYLASIPLYTVVDFRSKAEVENAPDVLPPTVKLYDNLSMEPGSILSLAAGSNFDIKTVDFNKVMEDMNRALVTDSSCIAQYKKFFGLVQDENNIPLLYHCSAGKDRTGMATALILYALGVDEQAIMNDYLASAAYLGDKYAVYIKQYPAIEPMMTVKPEYLQAGIDEINQKYGSVQNYLVKELGVDMNKMKTMFLYP